jgi:hypothetical protein
MKTKNPTNEAINALWYKFASDMLSRIKTNKLSFGDSSDCSKQIDSLKDMRNDLFANDRSKFPFYLMILHLYDAKGLKKWLTEIEIFSYEEVEILCKDCRRIERAWRTNYTTFW